MATITLRQLIPDPNDVARMHPGYLAGCVLEVLLSSSPGTGWWSRSQFCGTMGTGYVPHGHGADERVIQACAESWAWLEANGLICPDPKRRDDSYVPTRRAHEVKDRQGVRALIASKELPEHFLHPEIVQRVRSLFLQGRLDTAVFEAFKALEVEIRAAAGLGNECYGVKLASTAFNPDDGPLTDRDAERSERVALMNLMIGALGSYKNPTSHRRVDLTASEAREMIMLASHLLGIVDSRRAARGP